MDDEELDDTVMVPRESRQPREALDNEDTVLRDRSRSADPGAGAAPSVRVAPLASPPRPAPVAPAPAAPPSALAAPAPAASPPALVAPPERAPARRARDRRDDPVPEAPAPATWYRLSLDGAEPIALDTPVLVGRDPRPQRVATGEAARLIAVGSPMREVSATHLGVRQDGASVIVTDMRSTNGTVITMPGSRVFTLHAGDSLVAVPGTLLDIGDSHVIEILPIQRRHHDQEPFERLST